MSKIDPKTLRFFEAMVHDLAQASIEDEEQLARIAADPKTAAMAERIREKALGAIAIKEREALEHVQAETVTGQPRRLRSRLYEALSGEALLETLRSRMAIAGPTLAVQHRDLESLPPEDLRSLLVDLDKAAENDKANKQS